MMDAFGGAYRAIDLRAVAVKRGGSWENVYTVVRFTYEEPDVAAKRLRQIEESRGGVHTDSFQILLVAFPVSEWDRIRSGLSLQNLAIGDIKLAFKAVEVNLRCRSLSASSDASSDEAMQTTGTSDNEVRE
jgi:hypothetical protein